MVSSMSEAVRVCFERYAIDFEFGLWDLKRDVQRLYPPSKFSHADTVSRRLREFKLGKGFVIVCINPNKSRYMKVKCAAKGKTAMLRFINVTKKKYKLMRGYETKRKTA